MSEIKNDPALTPEDVQEQEHHHHHDENECGCGHEHHHHDEDECGCSHEHHHHHEDECGCGHEHHHHDHEPVEPVHHAEHLRGKTAVYLVENLDCANCAAKLERKLNDVAGVEDVTITYATRQMRVTAPDPEALLGDIQEVIDRAEPGVVLRPLEGRPRASHAEPEEEGHDLVEICIGAAALLAALLTHHLLPEIYFWVTLLCALAGYLLVGRNVLLTAGKNLAHGKVFDENFLMSIATIGAFAIGEYPEALGVMLFYRVGEFFEDRAVAQSRSNIMDALDLRPEVVTLLHDGVETILPAEEARVGDLVQVRPGDRIPLDGVVVRGESQVDTSAVTGEPVPVSVRPGDKVVSGCVNNTGLLTVRVEAVLAESMVSRILDSVENAAAAKPQIDRFITRFSRVYTPVVVAAALIVAVIPSLITGDWLYWVKTACTFLVISCPCALVLSVPLAFFAGIGAASKEQILFKGGNAMEALAKVKAVVLDKTGTITQGNFVVQALEPAPGVEANELLAAAAACELHSTHPIAHSIQAAAQAQGLEVTAPADVREVAGKGVAAAGFLCGNRALLEEAGVALPELEPAPGCTQVLTAKDGAYWGRILISDTVKPNAKKALTQLHQLGLTSVMLTGDGEESARAVADQVGIRQVRARLLPQEKLSALEEVRSASGGVLFVGDGINDAPVLAGADVGAAMGSGADAAIEAADLAFMTGELTAIPKAVRLARRSTAISRQNVVFALVVKALVLVAGLLGFANMWLAVFADTGVAMICIANSIRILYQKNG
ncbi:MAG: heavy metal translocating P-type ATPase [Clostridiales bacterium]|nr:heavy metal translocating P-type ATPase [Clostridiales bacterium]